MQLEAIPVQSSVADPQQLDLYLSLNFNEHWESLLNGRVKFGLQGGTLRLKLENCEIPLASRQLVGSFKLEEPDKNQPSNSSQLTTSSGAKSELVHYTACHISMKDSDANPAWVFAIEKSESVLKGLLKSAKLGQFTAKPCRIEVTFEVSKQDIHLTDAEGLWRHDITPNQHAVLERSLALYLLETKLQPYLSWAQLCYDCSTLEKYEVATFDPKAESHLQALIDQVVHAGTHNFLELANLVNLNLTIDFAGGNLRGTTLNGVDFSGANLYRVNLRGADLSDADLSDANLQEAKLGGADLSGAFLGDANLSHADLHRASFALANLSGADLRGANLREVNLVNANLSGTHVQDAQFGKNSGISLEMKHHLQQQGAIFEDE